MTFKQTTTDDRNLQVASRRKVASAYDCLDAIFSSCKVRNLTDGIYFSAETTDTEAQLNQINYLLDEISCHAGTRILDIGCGYGTLLQEAEKRGAEAWGVTLSGVQARHCQQIGLNIKIIDYRYIGNDWDGLFDGIVANGSLEHFVQPRDAAAGKAEDIYKEFFAICHRLLNPKSAFRKLVTTAIHFNHFRINPQETLKNPLSHSWGSPKFHYTMLSQVGGAYYPVEGILPKCAHPHFQVVNAVDGTADYLRTSNYLRKVARRAFVNPIRLPTLISRILPFAIRAPRQALLIWMILWVTKSWSWQFRGKPSPMLLWRHTWQAN